MALVQRISLSEALASVKPNSEIWSCSYNPQDDNFIAVTTSTENKLRICKENSQSFPHTFDLGGAGTCTDFSRDGSRVVAGSTSSDILLVTNINAETPEPVHLHGHTSTIRNVHFHPTNSLLLSSGWSDGIRVWDVNTQQMTRQELLKEHFGEETIYKTSMSEDGKLLTVCCSDGVAYVLETNNLKLVRMLKWSSPTDVQDASMRRTANRDIQIATASHDGTVKVWELGTGKVLHMFTVGYEASRVLYTPDGSRLCVGGKSEHILIYNVEENPIRSAWKLADPCGFAAIKCMDFSRMSGSRRMVTGHADSTLRVWNLYGIVQDNSLSEFASVMGDYTSRH
ncbi:uncharacterized WD repeat-containing protein alr3466-like [Branchiostoma floridae]|uniref:Uncharacterized WD repeat-containing protein alr3466-like n=1 Tax=Branchiostoma floridae TaxID=7739 RepID=A0A9J7L5F4_BRAFL|nr:uncharacterized WD repeat-containing protein alr3466-like [Branchiostoma floridae]